MNLFIEKAKDDPRLFMAVVITVVLSITLHELAHGITAIWKGDRTPIETGHMTLNPAVHMGIVSVIMLLVVGIAWGAMPINPRRMRGKYAEAIVAFAGPLSNFILFALAIGSLAIWQRVDERLLNELPMWMQNLRYLLLVFGLVNMHLGLFNLIPFPPLDGSRIAENFSDGYARMMNNLVAQGGYFQVMIILMAAGGALTGPLASRATYHTLYFLRDFGR